MLNRRPSTDRHLARCKTFVLGAVAVLGQGIAALARRAQESRVEWIAARIRRADLHRPFAAPISGRLPGRCFHALEIAEHIRIAPASAAELVAPRVVVLRIAARVDHAVDGRGPADNAAARLGDPAAAEPRLGHRLETPIVGRRGQQPINRERHVDLPAATVGPGLDQQNLDGRIFAQARGNRTTGRTGADDDEVVDRLHRNLLRAASRKSNAGGKMSRRR